MKILITLDDIRQELGGVSSSIAVLYKHFLKDRIYVQIGVSKNASKGLFSNFEGNKIKLNYANDLIKSNNVQLVHNNGIWTSFSVNVMRESFARNIKTIQSIHGMLEPWSLSQSKYKKKLALLLYQRKILENADLLHVSTKYELKSVRRLGIKNKVAIIPNGVDIQSELVIQDLKPKKLLFLSRIHQKKGVELLLNALKKCDYEFNLVIAGSGDQNYIAKLKRDVENLGLTRNVSFVGSVEGEEKKQLFMNSDFFVLPTYSENFGNVIAEALSYGKPVLTTNTTPWIEIQSKMCGYICSPSVDDILKSLISISKLSKKEYLYMQKNAFIFSKNYDVSVIAGQYLDTYRYLNGDIELPNFIDSSS